MYHRDKKKFPAMMLVLLSLPGLVASQEHPWELLLLSKFNDIQTFDIIVPIPGGEGNGTGNHHASSLVEVGSPVTRMSPGSKKLLAQTEPGHRQKPFLCLFRGWEEVEMTLLDMCHDSEHTVVVLFLFDRESSWPSPLGRTLDLISSWSDLARHKRLAAVSRGSARDDLLILRFNPLAREWQAEEMLSPGNTLALASLFKSRSVQVSFGLCQQWLLSLSRASTYGDAPLSCRASRSTSVARSTATCSRPTKEEAKKKPSGERM